MCREIDATVVLWNVLLYKETVTEAQMRPLLRRLEAATRQVDSGVYLDVTRPSIWAAIFSNPVLFKHSGDTISRGAPELFTTAFVKDVVNLRLPEGVKKAWAASLTEA
jgi:hypothetical protein